MTLPAALLPRLHAADESIGGLEERLNTLLATLEEGARFASVGLPVPGLAVLGRTEIDGTMCYVHDAPVGNRRARFDEQHQLALVHPRYDGFVVAALVAASDIEDLAVFPDDALAPFITAHHRAGPLLRGQARPIDLELHPGAIPAGAVVTGTLCATDMGNRPSSEGPVAVPLTVAIATDRRLDCVLAGLVDGPLSQWDHGLLVRRLTDGDIDARGAAAVVERGGFPAEGAPSWWRRSWRRRRFAAR